MVNRVTGTVEEILARYPYVPGTTPRDHGLGIERIQGINDDGLRRAMVGFYLAAQDKWAKRETGRRAKELRRQHQPLQAQSREHADYWNERGEK